MPVCTQIGCGKSWNPPDHFPLCITNPCPLRQQQRKYLLQESGEKELFYAPKTTTFIPSVLDGVVEESAHINNSLDCLRGHSGKTFKDYDMKGAKSATTTVTLRDGTKKVFKTIDQMHSEMLAIDWMLTNGYWTLYLGLVLWADDHSKIGPANFRTTQPHCGFCTVFLLAAGLPVGTPTYGNHQLASRLSYQLPTLLFSSPHYIARVLDNGCYCGFPALKRVLNALVNVEAEQWVLSVYGWAYVDDKTYVQPDSGKMIVQWAELLEWKRGEIIYFAWKVIYERIKVTNSENQ